MELLKVVSQILELSFFHFFLIFIKIKIPPPMSPGLILHKSFVQLALLDQLNFAHIFNLADFEKAPY